MDLNFIPAYDHAFWTQNQPERSEIRINKCTAVTKLSFCRHHNEITLCSHSVEEGFVPPDLFTQATVVLLSGSSLMWALRTS